MARPRKQGIDYFSFDCDFFEDVKIRKIARACGSQATSILICLLCNIYRDNGYYVDVDEDLPFLVADNVGTSEGAVSEVITKAVQVGFFDKDLYNNYNILTSSGIQKRFRAATIKREETEFRKEYIVSSVENRVSSVKNPVSSSQSTQSKSKVKGKNSKVNTEKENTPNGVSKKAELSSGESVDYLKLKNYFNETFRGKLPAINSITDARKKAVKARIAAHGKDSIVQVFELVLQSSFLLGGGDRNWRCDFDWIFKSSNYQKILENTYNGKCNNGASARRETVSSLKSLAGAILQGTAAEND